MCVINVNLLKQEFAYNIPNRFFFFPTFYNYVHVNFLLTPVSLQQGGQTQTLTLQPAQPSQGQPDGQNQTAVLAQSNQQGQQQQQQFLQVSTGGRRYD